MRSKILLLMTAFLLVAVTGCASDDSDGMDRTAMNESGMNEDSRTLAPNRNLTTDRKSANMRKGRVSGHTFENRTVLRNAQSNLKSKGYRVGSIDGVAGPKTKSAIEAFQRDSDLEVTGKINRETAKSLGIDFNEEYAE